ncbi:ABC transporter ATP-binding protein, partial [Candidatus Bathyarchaeota archaeon]|nr:ABC transporter ATP-binding protein [Candidatus Bathyarchaeota archaeon]
SLNSIISFFQRYINSYTSQKVVFTIRNELFTSLQGKSFSFYDRTQIGQLMARVTSDIRRMTMFYSFWMNSLFGSIIQIILIYYYLTGIDINLTLISLLTIPFVFAINYFFMQKIHPINSTIREKYGILNATLQQNIVGMSVVRIFTNEPFEMKKFEEVNNTFLNANMQEVKLRSIYRPFTGFLLGLGTAILYWLGSGEVIRNTLSLGSLLLFSQYMSMLTMPVRFVSILINLYSRAMAGAKRVFEIIDSKPEIEDKPNATKLPPIRGEVRFSDVTFEYLKDRPVLKDINFLVKPGETIAILGATGSGKSSLIYLIPRFYDVIKGNITIDDYPIRDVTLKSLRSKVGIVLQDIFLFSTTIKENIVFGQPDSTMEEIVKVSKLAQAHDFIMSFPEGYDTIVGERGVTLSGGQRQRVAIARTLLRDPRILILDDSTSFVDTKTEHEIQKALDELRKDRTTFVITQRLSTIKNADRILVLDNGKIEEIGTHKELLSLKGIYSQIYETQFAPKEELLVP